MLLMTAAARYEPLTPQVQSLCAAQSFFIKDMYEQH